MVYCSVPFCRSERKSNKQKDGIVFHEFPSKEEVRAAWIKSISRKENNSNELWKPADRAVVCSKHFKEDDYKQSIKRKWLKPAAIPSVFPGYPAYKVPSVSTKRKCPKDRSSFYQPTAKRKCTSTEKENNAPHSEPNEKIEPHSTADICSSTTEAHVLMTTSSNVPLTASPVRRGKKKMAFSPKRNKQRLKDFSSRISKLKQTVRNLKANDKHLKEHCKKFGKTHGLQTTLKKIIEDAEHGNVQAQFLCQQIKLYGKKRCQQWDECVVRYCVMWRAKSPKGYEFARKKLFMLPSRSTLKRYTGYGSGETGVTSLVKQRLSAELKRLKPEAKYSSLIFDEMSIQPKLKYVPQIDKVIGAVDTGKEEEVGVTDRVANRLLCFVLKGLSTYYAIPVAYFFTRQLTGDELHQLILEVLREVEKIGFKVLRLVADDLSVNTKAFSLLSGTQVKFEIVHPCDETRKLFLSYDTAALHDLVLRKFLAIFVVNSCNNINDAEDTRSKLLKIKRKPLSRKVLKLN